MKIGYINDFYPERRCIINKVKDIKYKKINYYDDYNKLYHKILKKININKSNMKEFVFSSTKKYDVDIIHTFNSLCDVKNIPWVTTFETLVPRNANTRNFHQQIQNYKIDKEIEKQLQLLEADDCKKIIALSNCSKEIQKSFLRKIDKTFSDKIIKKITVIPPPQELIVSRKEIENKFEKGLKEIKFIFVGNDFFRKGGLETVKVLKKLKEKFEIKLTIVSSFNINDYATLSNNEDKEKMLQMIKSNQEWITSYTNIANEEVLELIRDHHIGLLPSFADTYGYSVLEMQAAGVPVVTTNIRALPEINNENCGWIVPINKNEFGEALYNKDETREKMRNDLEINMLKIIEDILTNKDTIKEKALNAITRIEKNHDPKQYANKLMDIYNEIIDIEKEEK